METILNILLEITIYSGILFIFILFFKKAFQKQISASLNYLVWMVLILRLLIPLTIDSNINIFEIFDKEMPTIQTVTSTETQTGINIKENSGVTEYSTRPEMTQQNPLTTYTSDALTDTSADWTHINIDWTSTIVLVWTFGMIAYFSVMIWLHLRFQRIIGHGTAPVPNWVIELTESCTKELHLRRRVRIHVQDKLATPALTLSLKPELLLPQSMLYNMSQTQVMLGIRHELSHYKRRDHLMSLLLLILRGVYWFNPLVWAAHRMILSDMETACDARAAAKLEKEQRNLYIRTIIDLGCKGYAHCTLGMSTGRGKRTMERRIHSMFKKHKTGYAARIATGLLIPLLLMTCFTTACQPTPTKPIVQSKNEDLSSYVETSPETTDSATEQAATTLYEKLGAPEHWQIDTQEMDGKLNISADVDIELPAVSALPVATAVLREFSQEDIENSVKTVLGDNLTYTESVDWTKERLESLILDVKLNIAMQKEGKDPGTGVWYDENDLAYFENMLTEAPAESELQENDLSIETIDYYNQTYQGVRVNTVADDQLYYIQAGDLTLSDAVYNICISVGNEYSAYFDGTYLNEPYGVSLTKDEAAKQARTIASKLTDELKLCYVVPTAAFKEATDRNWGWACVFMREINGCPTAYASEDVGSSIESMEQKPIRYEKMIIVLDDLGVTSFTWESPMAITSIDNTNVDVLPFDDIAAKAVEQLAVCHKYDVLDENGEDRDAGCTVNVTKVELGLMRVMKADSSDYYYIPVWNFFSEVEHTAEYQEKYGDYKETIMGEQEGVDEDGNLISMISGYPQAFGAVTINALDGSIIDRNLGY